MSAAHPQIPQVRGRRGLPVVGSLPFLWRDPARGLVALYEDYGPLFTTKVPGRTLCFAIGPQANEVFFKTRLDAITSEDGLDGVKGRPVGTLDGEAHQRVRGVMQAAFHGAGLSALAPTIASSVREAVSRWDDGVPILQASRALSLHTVLRAAMGAADSDLPRLTALYHDFARAFFAPRIPIGRYKTGLAARDQIDAWLRERMKTAGQNGVSTLLDVFLQEGGHQLSPNEILENLRILGVAGHETTGTVLAWIVIQLARDGALWDAVCREVPAGTALPLSLREASEFRLVRAVVQESLRLYTPAWYVPRTVCADDLELHGFPIPRGTLIGVSPLATHHLPDLWPDPFRFDVNRWAKGFAISPNVFLPYGGGPHLCVGAAFAALQMAQVVIALASGRRRPTLARSDYDFRPFLLPFPHPSPDIRIGFAAARTMPRVKKTLPVVGILPRLWRDPARGLIKLYEQHGPVFATELPGQPVCMAIGPEANEALFRAGGDSVSARVGNGQFSWLMGEPVEVMDGEEHQRVRAILQPLLRSESLTDLAPLMASIVRDTIDGWDDVSIWESTRLLTLAVILRAGLGVETPDMKLLERLFDDFTHAFFAPKIRIRGSAHVKGLRARDGIDEWLRRRVLNANAHDGRKDLLSVLLAARDRGEADLTPAQFFDNLRILVFAGQETTASILAWSVIHLAQDDELWAALCADVPAGAALPLSLQELRDFPFIKALLNETLRRYTPAWFVPRGIVRDVTLHGITIPKGTMVGLSPLATHHLAALWPDPFRFDVTRWLSDAAPSPNSFLPFGAGPHTCLGGAFAMLEMTQALVALAASRRRPSLARGADMRPVLLGLPHPSRRIQLRFERPRKEMTA